MHNGAKARRVDMSELEGVMMLLFVKNLNLCFNFLQLSQKLEREMTFPPATTYSWALSFLLGKVLGQRWSSMAVKTH